VNEPDATSGWDRFLALLVVFTFILVVLAISGQVVAFGLLIILWAIVLTIPTVRNKLYQEYRTFIRADEGNSGAVSPARDSATVASSAVPLSFTPPPEPVRPTYNIHLPKDTQWQPAKATSLITQLISLGNVILRIKATPNSIVWQVIDANASPWSSDVVVRAIHSVFLEAEVTESQELTDPLMTYPLWRRVDYFTLAAIFPAPLLTAREIHKTDPLNLLVNALSDLREGESVSYLIALAGYDEQILKLAEDLLYHTKVRSAIADAPTTGKLAEDLGSMAAAALLSQVFQKERKPRYVSHLMEQCRAKLTSSVLQRCFIAVEANSREEARLANFYFPPTFLEYANEQQGLLSTESPFLQVTGTEVERETRALRKVIGFMAHPIIPLQEQACVLNVNEIAALWHLPHTGMSAPEVAWIRGKQVAAPPEFRGEQSGVLLGTNRTSRTTVFQPLSERTTHTLILGKTGTGKTSLMHALVEQDIRAGHGVAVIDPVGNFIRRLLQHSIPPERENDVVILDIDFKLDGVFYPPPINITARPARVNSQESAFQFASVLAKLYSDIDQTRWLQTLEAALLTLSAEDQPTLLDIKRVLRDDAYRESLLAKQDFSIAQLWEDIELGGGLDKSSLAAIVWRLNRFTLNPIVQAITCHPKPLDMASLLGNRKIILVSVAADENKVPETARNVLGAIVLAQIQTAALSGAIVDPLNKHPFMLYIDEVQNFVTSSLDVIARQARQKRLGLVVSTQYARSIAPKTLKALEGNIGTLVAFETDDDDASHALPLIPTFTATDLTTMGRFKAVVSMRSATSASRSAFNLEPMAARDVSHEAQALEREQYLRRKSVENYTPMTYDEVKAWLDARYRPPGKPTVLRDDDDDFGNPIN